MGRAHWDSHRRTPPPALRGHEVAMIPISMAVGFWKLPATQRRIQARRRGSHWCITKRAGPSKEGQEPKAKGFRRLTMMQKVPKTRANLRTSNIGRKQGRITR